MATQSKATRTRLSKPRPQPVEEVLEDDPTDPDNGDPAGWPDWTDRHIYTITKRSGLGDSLH